VPGVSASPKFSLRRDKEKCKPAFVTKKLKLLFSLVVLVEALLIAFALVQRYPTSGDDYSYLYQAQLFASGKMYAESSFYDEANPLHDCVRTNCISDNHGRRFSKYPPGGPAFLALGALLGMPWLINPILGALLAFLILRYVEQQMGKELVRVTGFLLTLCLFFSYYAASLRPHITTALFVFAAFVAYDAAQRRPGSSRLLLFSAGALLGYSSLIRYIDWVPLAAWIGVRLLRRKRFSELILFGVGFGLLASGNLLYDTLLSGDPLQTPTALNHSPGMHDRLMISWIGILRTVSRLVNLLWVFPPFALLVVFWKRYQAPPKVRMYLALFLMNLGLYFFYPASGGGPGPRYLLGYFPFLLLAVVDLYRWLGRDAAAGSRRLWNYALALQIIGSVSFLAVQGYSSYCQRDLERTAAQAGDGKKIFFLKTGTYPDIDNVCDFTRNPPDISSASSLYFNWCGQPERDALLKQFPGREVFVYEYPAHLSRVADSR
jgi:hypothetical protein